MKVEEAVEAFVDSPVPQRFYPGQMWENRENPEHIRIVVDVGLNGVCAFVKIFGANFEHCPEVHDITLFRKYYQLVRGT